MTSKVEKLAPHADSCVWGTRRHSQSKNEKRFLRVSGLSWVFRKQIPHTPANPAGAVRNDTVLG